MLPLRVKVAKSTFTTMPGDVAVLKTSHAYQYTSLKTTTIPRPNTACTPRSHSLSAYYTLDSPEVRTSLRRIDHCRAQIILSRTQGDADVASEGGQVHLHHYAGGRVSPDANHVLLVHLSQDHHHPSAKHS